MAYISADGRYVSDPIYNPPWVEGDASMTAPPEFVGDPYSPPGLGAPGSIGQTDHEPFAGGSLLQSEPAAVYSPAFATGYPTPDRQMALANKLTDWINSIKSIDDVGRQVYKTIMSVNPSLAFYVNHYLKWRDEVPALADHDKLADFFRKDALAGLKFAAVTIGEELNPLPPGVKYIVDTYLKSKGELPNMKSQQDLRDFLKKHLAGIGGDVYDAILGKIKNPLIRAHVDKAIKWGGAAVWDFAYKEFGLDKYAKIENKYYDVRNNSNISAIASRKWEEFKSWFKLASADPFTLASGMPAWGGAESSMVAYPMHVPSLHPGFEALGVSGDAAHQTEQHTKRLLAYLAPHIATHVAFHVHNHLMSLVQTSAPAAPEQPALAPQSAYSHYQGY